MFAKALKKQKASSALIFKPDWWQIETIKQQIVMAAAAVLSVPGTGKTMCMLSTFVLMMKAGKAKKMLVVSKRRIIHNVWPKEIAKWDTTEHLTYAMVHGPKKAEALRSEADIYLINFEGLAWLAGYTKVVYDPKTGKGKIVTVPGQPKRFREQFDVICIDESTMVKNWTAQRTRCLKKVIKTCKRRYTLSGTPTPNGMIDIFAQIYMLDMGASLGKSIVKFRNEHFYPSGFGGYYFKLQEGAEEKIYDKISHLVIRYGDEVLNLKPYVVVERPFVLPDKVRKVYREMEEDFITEIENAGVVFAVNSGVASTKCRQICSGAVYRGRGKNRVAEWIHDEKIEELSQLIDELRGRPCLIAYVYDHERVRIQKAMKIPHIGGGVSDKRAKELEDEWNAGKLPALLVQPDSVSHGLNLQENGGVICFFSADWNLENHHQLIRRLWRKGYEGTLYVYYILAEDTVEEVVVSVLKIKENEQQRLLEALQARYGVRKMTRMTRTNRPKLSFPGKRPARLKVIKVFVAMLERLETTKKNFPRYELFDQDEGRATYNFAWAISCQYSGWSSKLHAEFLSNVYGTKVDSANRLDKLFNSTNDAIMSALGVTETDDSRCYLVKDRSALLKLWPTKYQRVKKESNMAGKSKFASKKKAASKKTSKRSPSKKQAANAARADTQRAQLIKLLSRKSGVSISQAAESLRISEPNIRSIIGALRKASVNVKSQGNGVFKI